MKILIIKLGLSETLDQEIGRVSSLGDVLRTTPILHALREKYPESKITWLVDDAAYPLLHKNKFIDRTLVWDSFTGFQLMEEKFDIVINLEKIPGLCAITNKINAWKKYGFRFDEITGSYNVYEGAEYAFDLCTKHEIKTNNSKFWQEILVEMIGCKWKDQPYVLGYKPKLKERYDVGFNHKVGSKFPEKAWGMDNWKSLERMLEKDDVTITWQEGLNNLYEYIDWINTCKVLITSDSLGLHLGLVLNKKVIGLFGPTSSREIFFYDQGTSINKVSMSDVDPQEVFQTIREYK